MIKKQKFSYLLLATMFLPVFLFFLMNPGRVAASTLYWNNIHSLTQTTADSNPRSIATDGQKIFIANQGAGTVSVYSIFDLVDGFTKLSTITTGQSPDWITYANGHIYVVTYQGKLLVYDSNTYAQSASADLGGSSVSVAVSSNGQFVYVANSQPINTVQVFNFNSGLGSLTEVGSISSNIPFVNSVTTDDSYLYLVSEPPVQSQEGALNEKLMIYDISAHTNPIFVSSIVTGIGPTTVTVSGNYVYVANIDSNSVQVFNVANKNNPQIFGSVPFEYASTVYVSGNYLYVSGYSGLSKYDISAHANPVLVGSNTTDNIIGSVVVGDYLYGISYTHDFLKAFSLSDVHDIGLDTNWTTLEGNWWTDQAHTHQALSLPDSNNDTIILGATAPTIDLDSHDFVQPKTIDDTGLTGDANTSGVIVTSQSGSTLSVPVTGNANFNLSARNGGTINGSALFNGDLSENAGTINGIKTRRYYSDSHGITISSHRNFVTSGPWGVLADGVTVNRANAVFDETTTFLTANDGSFSDIQTNVYWYNIGLDTNWTTLEGNWWTDQAHTHQALSLPDSNNDTIILGATAPTIDLDSHDFVQPKTIDDTGLTGDANTSGVIVTSQDWNCLQTPNVTGNVTFNNNATNYSTINGNAYFYDSAANTSGHCSSFSEGGIVNGNAYFYGDLTENSSTVNGIKRRIYNSDTTPSYRDLTNWTTLADGAVVDLSSSSYDSSALFEIINGGSFDPIDPNGLQPIDVASPIVTAAKTSGARTIILTMSNPLSGSTGDPSAFTIGGVASNPLVEGVSISGTAVTLTIDNPILYTESSITVSYTKTGAHNLTNGVSLVPNFLNHNVNNQVTHPVDSVPSSGGGGGGYFLSPVSPATSTIASLQLQIQNLQALIQQLLSQRQSSVKFTKDLYLGNVDPQVKLLQQFLNLHNFSLAVSGVGSLGNETTKFGYATQTALKKFQKLNHITPSGIFGLITRGVANGMLVNK